MPEASYARGPEWSLVESTLADALAQTARRFPEREALVARHQNLRFTWREFDLAVARVARGLAGLGLQARDRVGIWSTNCVEWLLLQYACARAGFVLVNVNPAYRSHELAFVLKKSQMRAIFYWENDARTNYQHIMEEARSCDQALEHAIRLGTADWETMLASGADLPRDSVRPGDVTNIQYTSGTTGSPKGVLLTHRGLLNNGLATGDLMNMTEQDRMCVGLPLYHCGGCVCSALNCVTHGATIILSFGLFDPRALLQAVDEERATALSGVPTMFIAELQHPEFSRFDLTSLRAALIGGAPCPVDLLKRMNSDMHCKEVTVIYGQTEASPVITMHAPGDTLEQRSSTVGRVIPNAEVKIVSTVTGETVPVGDMGELCVRGYSVMTGYDQEPQATARAIDPEGWLHTGDLALMRPDGHFHIRGRLKELILRGGENIYPAEIESFLFSHPKIAEVQVVGLPDLKLGEIVAAWIRPKTGEVLTEDEVRAYCQANIAHFKVPRYIRFVDSFPMTITGKVQKFRIREIEIQERGLHHHSVHTA